jgi:hypothetical protein
LGIQTQAVPEQLFALPASGAVWFDGLVGIGVGLCFHNNLGVARFRSPANTHAIYFGR